MPGDKRHGTAVHMEAHQGGNDTPPSPPERQCVTFPDSLSDPEAVLSPPVHPHRDAGAHVYMGLG